MAARGEPEWVKSPGFGESRTNYFFSTSLIAVPALGTEAW
jgi:hypothetical protein